MTETPQQAHDRIIREHGPRGPRPPRPPRPSTRPPWTATYAVDGLVITGKDEWLDHVETHRSDAARSAADRVVEAKRQNDELRASLLGQGVVMREPPPIVPPPRGGPPGGGP